MDVSVHLTLAPGLGVGHTTPTRGVKPAVEKFKSDYALNFPYSEFLSPYTHKPYFCLRKGLSNLNSPGS